MKQSNKSRSRRAEQTLTAYAALVGRMDELAAPSLAATLLTDMLADFMHYARSAGIDFRYCVETAEMHFDAEIAEARRRGS